MSSAKSTRKSTSPKPDKSRTGSGDKKHEELTRTIEALKTENEELKRKLKLICKKVVDNVDMSEYSFIDAENVEPDEIELNDLLHMIQKLALMATQVGYTLISKLIIQALFFFLDYRYFCAVNKYKDFW